MRPNPLLRTECGISQEGADVSCALGHRIYTEVLRKPYPTRDQIDTWLQRYDRGVCRAFDQRNKLWGYISLWPLAASAFNALKTGEIGEDDLDGSMVAPRDSAPFAHWYVADILRDNQLFHRNVPNSRFAEYIKPLMVHACLNELYRSRQFAPSFEIIGLAVTRPGEQMLKREFQFEKVLPIPPHRPAHRIYLKALTTAELPKLLARLRRRVDLAEREIRTSLYAEPSP